jgi:hypothetical protein
MLKKIIYLISIILFYQNLYAQFDTIHLINGNKIPALIKEVSDATIKYKNPRDSTGPTIVIKKKMVERLALRSGCIEMREVGYDNCVKDPSFGTITKKDFAPFIISLDAAQLFIKHVQPTIEYVFPKRTIGAEVYFNVGLENEYNYLTYTKREVKVNPVPNYDAFYYKKNYVGFQLKVYPYAHKKITYWIGFGVDFGNSFTRVTYSKLIYTGAYYPSPYTNQIITNVYSDYFQSFNIKSGIVYRPIKNVALQSYLVSGINRFIKPSESGYSTENKTETFIFRFAFGLNLGIAF